MSTEARKIDPIHFFNSCGLSAYGEAYYLERIAELEAENQRLQRLVRRREHRETSDLAN